jgi:diacylglycerol kinase family enzyme
MLEFHRPRALLVFVNPIAGRGKAVKLYNDKVAPLFDLAGICTDVILTERRHHAKEMIRRLDLNSFDGFVLCLFIFIPFENVFSLEECAF